MIHTPTVPCHDNARARPLFLGSGTRAALAASEALDERWRTRASTTRARRVRPPTANWRPTHCSYGPDRRGGGCGAVRRSTRAPGATHRTWSVLRGPARCKGRRTRSARTPRERRRPPARHGWVLSASMGGRTSVIEPSGWAARAAHPEGSITEVRPPIDAESTHPCRAGGRRRSRGVRADRVRRPLHRAGPRRTDHVR